jgi:hypothetical protein
VDVSVGTTRGATDVIAWSPMTGLSGSTISATYPVPPLASGHSYWLQFRSRNGVGLTSTVAQVQVALP